MDLLDLARMLRRRWRLLLLGLVLAIGGSAGVTVTQTKVYTAKTQLFVSTTNTTDVTDLNSGNTFTQARVKSYADIISGLQVASRVKSDLNLSMSPAEIADEISASAPLDTVLLNVSVEDTSASRAQSIANALGAVFPTYVGQIEQADSQGVSPVKLSVTEQAELPTAASSPRPKLNLALGLLVGLAVGIGAALLRETFDTTVRGVDQTLALVGAPVLGAIAFDPEAAKRPLVVSNSPNSPRAEAFRQLRTNLQFVDIEHPLRSVVVTSSLPGEGKSTTTCNLAIAVAQAGLRVILVEADLRRPRIADYMGVEGAGGLTSVLLGRSGLDDVLQPWGDGDLKILASGPLPPNPSELLGSSAMQELLRELEQRADLILIDAPPLLPVTDAAVLGTLCSGVVILVASNRTRREQLQRAAETLQSVGAQTLGAILNMVPSKGPDAYAYGYGYAYGYSSKSSPTVPKGGWSGRQSQVETASVHISESEPLIEPRGLPKVTSPKDPDLDLTSLASPLSPQAILGVEPSDVNEVKQPSTAGELAAGDRRIKERRQADTAPPATDRRLHDRRDAIQPGEAADDRSKPPTSG